MPLDDLGDPNAGLAGMKKRIERNAANAGGSGDSGHPGTGAFSIQLGDAAYATGDYSVAVGQNAGADYYGTALGPSTYADPSAVAIGDSAAATGNNAVSIGKGASTQHFNHAVALGYTALANDTYECKLGGYNHKVLVDGRFGITTTRTPSGTADTQGNTGDLAWDANYFYVKTAAGWKRSALSTF